MIARTENAFLRGRQARAQVKLHPLDLTLTGLPRNLAEMAEKESGLSQLLISTRHSFGSSDLTHARVSAFVSAPHAARCVACHGVRSQAVPIALVGECLSQSCRTSLASRARRSA